MPQCNGICKTGLQCKNKAKTGLTVCAKHAAQAAPAPAATCGHVMTNGKLCTKKRAAGLHLCSLHHTVVTRHQRQVAARAVFQDVLEQLWIFRDAATAQQVFVTAVQNGRMPAEHVVAYTVLVNDEIAFFQQDQVLHPAPAPVGQLHAFVLDNQNVHTGIVNAQTDAGLQVLLDTPVPASQKTADEIRSAWASKPNAQSVGADMRRWYRTVSCRTANDNLYKRALDGLWARIKTNPDLVQRLWEEAVDSVGMCCDGHLARLCNVMVGFDDAFKPQVSTGELLQQRMAAIAAEDIDTLLKVERAHAVFQELGVPEQERGAWIEAF